MWLLPYFRQINQNKAFEYQEVMKPGETLSKRYQRNFLEIWLSLFKLAFIEHKRIWGKMCGCVHGCVRMWISVNWEREKKAWGWGSLNKRRRKNYLRWNITDPIPWIENHILSLMILGVSILNRSSCCYLISWPLYFERTREQYYGQD